MAGPTIEALLSLLTDRPGERHALGGVGGVKGFRALGFKGLGFREVFKGLG